MIPEEEIAEDQDGTPEGADQDSDETYDEGSLRNSQSNRRRKKGKGKAAAQKGEKEAAEQAAEKEAAHLAEKQVAKRALLRAGLKTLLAAGSAGLTAILAAPDIIRLLKSKYGKWAMGGCCVCGCLPGFIVLGFFAMFLVIVIGFFGGQGNNMCPSDTDIPDKAFSRLTNKDDCYKTSLMKAEEQTNVPWEIIASLDFRQFESKSDLNNLLQIGAAVQRSNRLRDKTTGELTLDKDGNTINTITPDINDGKDSKGVVDHNVMAAISIMANYKCVYARGDEDPAKNAPLDIRENMCFRENDNNKGCDVNSGENCQNGAEYARVDPWIVNELQTGEGVPGKVWDSIVSIPFLGGAINGIYDTVTVWKDHTMGAATFYVNITGVPDACKDSDGGAPGGTSPVCNDPNLKKPGDKALCAAQKAVLLGKPYEWGGPGVCYGSWASCPALESISGFDCSGLAGWAWYQAGIDIGGGGASSQFARTSNHPDKGSLQPGDLVFFGESYSCGNNINGKCSQHVAIYEGENMVTHTYGPEDGALGAVHMSLDTVSSWYSAGIIGTARPE